MRARNFRVLAIAAIAISTPIHLYAGQDSIAPPGARVVSAEMGPILKEAQAAVANADYDLAGKLLAKADALPNKTADEQHIIDMMRKFILVKMAKPAMTPKP